VKIGRETPGENRDVAPFEALAEGAVNVVVVEGAAVEFIPDVYQDQAVR
jgi:hypothetical protein